MKFLRVFLSILAVAGLVGAVLFWKKTKEPSIDPNPVVPQAEAWRVVTTTPPGGTPVLLWNGILGTRISVLGLSVDGDKELSAFLHDRYQPVGEEKIEPIPSLGWRAILVNGKPISAQDTLRHRQILDFRTGAVRLSYEIRRPGGVAKVVIDLKIDPDRAIYQQKVRIEGPIQWKFDVVTRQAGLNRAPGVDGFAVAFSSRPVPVAPAQASKTQAIEVQEIYTYGGPMSPSGPESLAADFWTTDIEIEGNVEDQQAVRAMLLALRTSIHPDRTERVSPMMLSSDVYFGHVFWDADIWVFPALALLDPDRARVISEYRLGMAAQARQNALEAAKDPNIPFGDRAPLQDAVMFPWESSVTGKETVPGPSRQQHHITGSVAKSLQMAADLGLIDQGPVTALGKQAANFWLARSERMPDGNFGVRATMSPDEFHIGDNDLYTNILAEWCIRRYRPELAREFLRPRDATTFLTYDKDRLRTYKQAAALLAVYPLQDPAVEKEAEAVYSRFHKKTVPNGPAMSDSIHSIVAARLGRKEDSYAHWRASWVDFTRHPLLAFSEKRRSSRTYFTTGAAGTLQAVLFGFGGLRIDDQPQEGSAWSKELKNGRWLSVRPNLPNQWSKLTLRGLHILGDRYTMEITSSGVKVTEENLSSKATP